MYKESKDYGKADDFLNRRFEKCKTIPSTHGLHCALNKKKLQFESDDIFFLPKLQNCELRET